MNTVMIDVTGIDLAAFAKAVYRLSVPVGMGILHAQKGELDDETATDIANHLSFAMDYIHGRCCKMHLRAEGGKLLAPDTWYDHTDADYSELLSEFGFSMEGEPEHGCACECNKCKPGAKNRYREWEKCNAAPKN